MHKPLAITMGDPGGIGPEIVLKCFLKSLESNDSREVMKEAFIVGDLPHLDRARLSLGESAGLVELKRIERIDEIFDDGFIKLRSDGRRSVPVLEVIDKETNLTLGAAETAPLSRISAFAGQISAKNIFWGARAALRSEVAALVTAPINKQSLALAGVEFPGHTEMLQFVSAEHMGVPVAQMPVRMMLASPELRVVLVSIHLSLRSAIEQVTLHNIVQTLKITHESLSKVLGRAPRIAVAGLNPHSGEGGLMGQEELEIIGPAILNSKSIDPDMRISGPFAPDTVFMQARTGAYDVVIAMYHDQGLIPIKYMGLDQGVNVTLGLPLIRTSPDHGTAFEIAGQGVADPSSMWAAVELARAFLN
jgi:4-hydroxythreonine-4-phosphate dehydrogenase